MKKIVVRRAVCVAADSARVFAAAADCDAPSIFKAHGTLPGVTAVCGHAVAWSAPGQTRILTLTDGGSLREQLTGFAAGARFAYRADAFTGPFAALVAETQGEWRAEPDGAGARLIWTYAFTPKSALAAPAVWFVARLLWPGYMQAALARLKQSIEQQSDAS